MANSWPPAELKNCKLEKPLSPIWASSSTSRKRQVTGFEPLHHIYIIYTCAFLFRFLKFLSVLRTEESFVLGFVSLLHFCCGKNLTMMLKKLIYVSVDPFESAHHQGSSYRGWLNPRSRLQGNGHHWFPASHSVVIQSTARWNHWVSRMNEWTERMN